MLGQETTQAVVWHCLNHYAYSDAVFLAERLYAEVQSDESLFLLATSYYRSGSRYHAYSLLKNHPDSSPQCRYLYACCAFELDKFVEAETALAGSTFQQRSLDELVSDFGDQACFALQLLAKICVKTERTNIAAEAFKRALTLNPFFWSCFVELCNLGEKPDANRTFELSGLDNLSTCHGMNTPSVDTVTAVPNITITKKQELIHYGNTPLPTTALQRSVNNTTICTPEESPLANPLAISGIGPLPPTTLKPMRCRNISSSTTVNPTTPNLEALKTTDISPLDFSTPNILSPTTLTEANDQKSLAKPVRAQVGQLMNRKETPLQNSKPVFSQSSNVSNTISMANSPATLTSLAALNLRSSRLCSESYSVKGNIKSPDRNKTPKSPSRKNHKGLAKANLNKNSYSELNAKNRSATLLTTQNLRRSSRLLRKSYTVKENSKSRNRNKCQTPKSPSRKHNKRLSKADLNKNSYSELNAKNRSETSLTTQNLRRSSRLLRKSYSVKENSKSIKKKKIKTPKSLSRKHNKRLAKADLNKNSYGELNAKNRSETSLTTQNLRRSSRLLRKSYSVKENNKSIKKKKFKTPKSLSRKHNKRLAKADLNRNSYCELNARNRTEKERTETITSAENEANGAISTTNSNNIMQQSVLIQKQCAEDLMALMRILGQAYLYLSQFECRKAIEQLTSIAPHQYYTSWVQNLLGKAYFELTEYEKSIEYFGGVHKREPYRLEFMDMYSTALWHLQEEVTLSALSQDLVKFDKESPITWCVAGNCFSLQKERNTALTFYQRAVQIDPNLPYPYTLLGHEYIMSEELDKALSSFRNAIRLDNRHYNAWFGIGTVYSKQEKFRLAEIYYLRALEINTHSSTLMCHLGVVQHAQKKAHKALLTLNTAIANEPKNPLCKFHRAQLYLNLGRHAEALEDLEELKEIAPRESLVYYLIGTIHKKLGHQDLALMHFSWAKDLDPEVVNLSSWLGTTMINLRKF